MQKTLVTIGAVLATFIALTPAQALRCSASAVMKMQSGAEKMAPSEKKDMAMKQMQMAKDDMAMKKRDDCMVHMRKARDMMFK